MKNIGEIFGVIGGNAAIEVLEETRRIHGGTKILVCKIDFDNNCEERTFVLYDKVIKMIMAAKTIVLCEDRIFRHMQLYSQKQDDRKICRRGYMIDVYCAN